MGLDTKSYSRALRGVMRAAPDVILIGEMRDRESMEAAINLSGTGHLVLATLHANNCAEALDRIINMFPRDQHNQIFLDLSQYLRRIMAQRLVMGKDGKRCRGGGSDAEHAAHRRAREEGRCHLDQGSDRRTAASGAFRASTRRCICSLQAEPDRAGRGARNADSRTNLEAKINFG